jgi:hypothetical protein
MMVDGKAVHHALAGVGILLILGGIAVVVQYCTGCSGTAAERALNAVEVAEWTLPYSHALDACRENARQSGSWKVYEACERAETRKVCNQRPGLKASWKRCQEVME